MADTTHVTWADMNASQKLAFCRANSHLTYKVMAKQVGTSDVTLCKFFQTYGIIKQRSPGGRKLQYDRHELLEKAAVIWRDHPSQTSVAKALGLKPDIFATIISFARRNGDERFPPLSKRGRPNTADTPEPVGTTDYVPRSEPDDVIKRAFLMEKPTLEAVRAAFAPNRALTPTRSYRLNAYQHAQLRNLRCAAL